MWQFWPRPRAGAGRYETRGSPGREVGSGLIGHVATPAGPGLGKMGDPVVVDLVFMLGLSRYLGVPVILT
jgi:hypothetical protein